MPEPFKIISDSAFPVSDELKGKILHPPKENQVPLIYNHAEAMVYQRRMRAVLAERQAAEWGMRAIQGCFGILRRPLPVESTQRKMILKVIWGLHNFRATNVGLNQIRSVYDDT